MYIRSNIAPVPVPCIRCTGLYALCFYTIQREVILGKRKRKTIIYYDLF